MDTEPRTDLSTHARSLRRLKWSAILFPTLFIWSSETVRHRFFDDAPVWLGNLITATVALLGSYLFARLMFRLIERVDAALVARNRRLATLYWTVMTHLMSWVRLPCLPLHGSQGIK